MIERQNPLAKLKTLDDMTSFLFLLCILTKRFGFILSLLRIYLYYILFPPYAACFLFNENHSFDPMTSTKTRLELEDWNVSLQITKVDAQNENQHFASRSECALYVRASSSRWAINYNVHLDPKIVLLFAMKPKMFFFSFAKTAPRDLKIL